MPREPQRPEEPPAAVHEPATPEPPVEAPTPPRAPTPPDTPEAPAASGKARGGLPWRRRRTKRDALARAVSSTRTEPVSKTEPTARTEPRAADRSDPPRRAVEESAPTPQSTTPTPGSRHEAVQDTHIDWAKLGATVVEGDEVAPDAPTPVNETRETNPRRAKSDNERPDEDDTAATDRAADTSAEPDELMRRVTRPQPTEPTFTRHESTIFDFDRLRKNTRGSDDDNDPSDKEKG